jgi:hypothetical protein
VIGGHPLWFQEELTRRAKAEQAERAQSLGRGDALDFAQYQHGVGYIAGLEAAIDISEQIKKEMDR